MNEPTVNQKIDEFLQIQQKSLKNLEEATEGLYAMGVRFLTPGEDEIPSISAAQSLLPRYETTLQDFEWKAIYDDGTELDEYGEKESTFADIDQKKLDKLLYISNFEIVTSNQEKRAIITLNYKLGTFEFLNCGAMDVRGKLVVPCTEDKKLILFRRKRESFSAGVEGQNQDFIRTGEKIIYTRYYLGYETPNKKIIICAYPNGDVQIE